MPIHGYKAHYSGRSADIYAPSSYAAYIQALGHFRPPASKKHMVHVGLCELNCLAPGVPGEQVIHRAVD
jgi:hypothetical protein